MLSHLSDEFQPSHPGRQCQKGHNWIVGFFVCFQIHLLDLNEVKSFENSISKKQKPPRHFNLHFCKGLTFDKTGGSFFQDKNNKKLKFIKFFHTLHWKLRRFVNYKVRYLGIVCSRHSILQLLATQPDPLITKKFGAHLQSRCPDLISCSPYFLPVVISVWSQRIDFVNSVRWHYVDASRSLSLSICSCVLRVYVSMFAFNNFYVAMCSYWACIGLKLMEYVWEFDIERGWLTVFECVVGQVSKAFTSQQIKMAKCCVLS